MTAEEKDQILEIYSRLGIDVGEFDDVKIEAMKQYADLKTQSLTTDLQKAKEENEEFRKNAHLYVDYNSKLKEENELKDKVIIELNQQASSFERKYYEANSKISQLQEEMEQSVKDFTNQCNLTDSLEDQLFKLKESREPMFSKEQIIEKLKNDFDHLDDAIMYFTELTQQ